MFASSGPVGAGNARRWGVTLVTLKRYGMSRASLSFMTLSADNLNIRVRLRAPCTACWVRGRSAHALGSTRSNPHIYGSTSLVHLRRDFGSAALVSSGARPRSIAVPRPSGCHAPDVAANAPAAGIASAEQCLGIGQCVGIEQSVDAQQLFDARQYVALSGAPVRVVWLRRGRFLRRGKLQRRLLLRALSKRSLYMPLSGIRSLLRRLVR